jgi:phosphoribosylaminoimidazolecarboxamide formyltransferase/IMP cyclohydrolase
MNKEKKISSALISVYHKDNLDVIIRKLDELGVTLYATGGTQEFIEALKIPVIPVETITDFPSILGGRVKTLHPRIFGGILGRRENVTDEAEMEEYQIPEIDLVIVDLYPFEDTVAAGKDHETIIEKIDIGGISLIRAAAKNFNDVLIIPSAGQYAFLSRILDEKNGVTSIEDRRLMSACAFNVSSHYDTAIFKWFNQSTELSVFKESIQTSKSLRYGENPHQKALFFGDLDKMFEQLNGKEISYNNLLDIDAGISLINEFAEPTIVIIKHNNACGLASAATIEEAWSLALEGDPVSAFGGVIISNRKIELPLATEMNKIFFEVAIAPAYQTEATDLLRQKKNRILLLQKNIDLPAKQFRTILNGVAEQDRDSHTETKSDMKVVTLVEPTENQYADMEFANKIVKHLKSNTIVLAKNKQLLGSGTGQTSRVDALKQAITKAGQFNLSLEGSVMASDAFFPFPDCVEIAGRAGVKAIIQPGGSIKDGESIDYCNCHHLVMVMTGYRHFKH